jgi:hypothetical protein
MLREFAPALVVFLVLLGGCRRQHFPGEPGSDQPYPVCLKDDGGAPLLETVPFPFFGQVHPEGETYQRLRLPDPLLERMVLEQYQLQRRGSCWRLTVRQEWVRQATDVEVIFDEALVPLRAWKRMTIPGSNRDDGHAEIRRYDLRDDPITIKSRTAKGQVTYEVLRGGHPKALIGPGRGILSMWIRRAKLAVGTKVREPVLDFREPIEKIRDVTLKREPDRWEPSLNRTVRVYTIYGSEAVFTDDTDAVVGDLAGLRPSAIFDSPEPPLAPLFGEPDPIHTP